MEGNKSSNRRSFVRKLLGLGAAAGATSLLLSRDKSLLPIAQAASGGYLQLSADYSTNDAGSATTSMTSSTTQNPGGTLYARNTSSGDGLHGWSQDGYGVVGETSATGGYAYGVVGLATNVIGVLGDSSSKQGVVGRTEGVSFTGTLAGVHGVAWTGAGVLGQSTYGSGVKGQATASSGANYGVHGISSSWNGRGVYGLASTVSGPNEGVRGESASVSGTGVLGYAGTTDGYTRGVLGQADSLYGVGVFGKAGKPAARPMVAQGASGQINNLQEWQNSSATALSAVDKDGKLGIGTSSPSFMLHIISGVTGPLTAASAPGAGPAPNSFICENLTSGNYKNQFTFKASGANKYSFGNDIAGTGGQNFFIWDEVGAEAALYIDSSRRVGLGTLSPTEKLHVVGNVKAASFITGDIVMSNDAKVTEQDDGFAFLNPKGEKIAVLDSEGNFRVRGKLIEGL